MVGLKNTLCLWGFAALAAAFPGRLYGQTAPVFTKFPLPSELSGTYATSYQYEITTSDDDGSPREIILSSGTLPNGISLTDNGDGSGVIEGFPLEIGSFPVELKVRETGSPFLEEVQAFTLEIGKAALMVTAHNKSRVYGQSNPTFTISITGFLNGDDATDLDVLPTASSLADQNSNVGNHDITTSGGSDDLYDFSYQSGQLSITKAILSVVADDKSITYGSAIPTLTAQYSGFVNSDDKNDIDTEPSINTTATATSGAGVYPITVSGGSDNNYSFSFTAADLTINKATLQVTADAKSMTYGQSLPALTATYTGFVHGDVVGDLDIAPALGTTATGISGAGTYPITPGGGTDNDYVFTYTAANLTIDKATLQVTADAKSMTYGQSLPTLTATYTGFVHGDVAGDLDTPPSLGTTATGTSGAGTYPITPIGGTDNDYVFTYTAANLTIGKATLQVTADAKTKVYGTVNPALTYQYNGFVHGDDALDLNTQPNASTTAVTSSPVASYPITLSGGTDNDYTYSFTGGQLTVTQATLTVIATNKSMTYGQSIPTLTFTYSGFVSGDNASDLDVLPTVSTTAMSTSGAGVYPITPSGGSDNNYAFTYTSANLTIGKAAIQVTAENKSMTYGQTLPALTATYTGFVHGDDAADIDVLPTITTAATSTSNVGTYAITASGASDNDYSFTYTSGNLAISKATLQVTADAKTKVYGSINPALTHQYSGFLNGDDAADLNTQPNIGTTATTGSNVGSYPISLAGGSDNNYSYSFTGAQLTITQATLTVIATNKSMTYGQAIPTLTFTYSGFVSGDNASDLDVLPTVSTTALATSGAGIYPITPTGGSDTNYVFTYTSANLTIGKAAIQVTVDSKSMTYGQTLPALTATYSGFVHGDGVADIDVVPTITTLATSTSSVGTYTITASGASDNNYSFTYTSGNLTISKATLQVIADAKTKVYGSTNPTLTYQYSGFLNGENATVLNTQPSISTSANAASHVGTYAINVSGGSDNNYSYNYTGALLTVTQAVLDVTADNKSRVYGATNPTFTKVYSGFVNGDNQADLTTIPTLSTPATATSNTGIYSIDVSGGFDDDYSFQYHAGQLTITKATVNVSASNATRIYGQPNPTFSLIFTGFANGETESIIDGLPTATTTAGLNSNVGTYPISVSGGSDNNYSFTYGSGTLTVTKATASVQITNLLQNVDGTPKPVVVTTTPTGLAFNITYNGSATVPTAKGTYNVQVTIQETNYDGSASASYVLNGPPVMLSTPSLSFNEDSGSNQLDLVAFVDDTEQTETTLQYSVISVSNPTLFQQATISGSRLTVIPATDKYGSGSVLVRITDSQSLFVETTVSITVNNVQDAPVFTSTPITVGAQDVLYTYNITTSDVDLTDVLTISNIVALPSWLTLTNNGNGTATLSGTPGSANIGVSGVAIQVSDNKGGVAQQFFNINVLEGQFPPQFTSTAITTARENTVYSYTATTSDVNGGTITYTAPTLPSWITATSNGTGGFVLTGTPNLSHVYFENGNLDYPVVIRATDNTGLFSEQSFQIRVLYENSPPTVILTSSSISIAEDSPTTDFNLTGITDGGEIGQVITLTATTSPANIVQATVGYQSPQTTALIHIQPVLNANGAVTLTIRVQDNGKTSKNFVEKTVSVTVTPVNDPPAITSTPTIRVNAGASYSYSVVATDPDVPDNLTFQLISAPAWLSISPVNNREALVSGNAPANGSDAQVKIRVSDPSVTSNDQEFTLIVNKPPVLQTTSAETNEDAPLELNKAFFQNLISDPNSDEIIKFKITQLPQGQLKFNGQSLAVGSEIQWNTFDLITYIPPPNYSGTDAFQWNASDGLLYADAAAPINLTILTENDPPEIGNLETKPISFSQGDPGIVISSQLTLFDVDDTNLQGAVVFISEGFETQTDELAYVKPVNETSAIAASFNKQTGELTLTGEATKSSYETALRNVKYKSTFLGMTDKLSRKVSIQVSDLVSSSVTVHRNLTIIRVLPDIEIVNAFTPNGDGVNDTWDFNNLIAYESIKIFVFDGSGKKVYECKDSNCAWDGTFKGKELPPGQYLYTIDLEDGRRQYQGTVTLLK